MHIDNPAGRLHTLLKSGTSLPDDTQVLQGWATLLETEPKNHSLLLRRIGFVYALPGEIRTKVELLEGVNHDLYLRPIPEVESALTRVPLHGKWQQIKKIVTGEVLLGLEHCANLLSERLPEPSIESENLESLLEDVLGLLRETQSANIPDVLRDFLVHHLLEMAAAINEIKVRGVAGIREAVEKAYGDALLRVASDESAPAKAPISERFWRVIRRAGNLVVLSNQTLALPEAVGKILES